MITSKSSAAQIIDYIATHGQARAVDLQKTLGISNVAIHKQLRKLIKMGEIKKIGDPPYVIYISPDTKQKNLIQLEKIKKQVFPILQNARVKKAALFGSYVRGDNTPESDIDILVDLPVEATLIDLVGIKQDLEEKLHKKVDVITYRSICPLIKDSVLNNQYPVI